MTDNTQQMLADQAAREHALLPTRSFIVQAPAGSGKTELLTQRYLCLLATVAQPEQILAITFTRKAASEMRNRIVQAMNNVSNAPRPGKLHAAHTWDLAQAALQASRQHGWQLETHPLRLRIQTIDAFNASLARRLPILSGTGATMKIATDTRQLYEAAAQRLLEQLGDGSEIALSLEVVLTHVANRVPGLVEMLCDLLQRRDHWLPLLISHRHDTDLRNSIETTLQAAIEHHLQKLQRVIPVVLQAELVELAAYSANNRLQNGVKTEDESHLHACGRLESMPATAHDQLLTWRGLATVVCKKDGEFYASLSKTQGFPADNKDIKHRMLALLNVFRDIEGLAELFSTVHQLPAPYFNESQWQVLSALLQVLPQAVAHLQLEFQLRGQVDYVELSLRAQRALGTEEEPTDLALALDTRLQHVLVDEFQDTSITQMQLLRLLTAGWSKHDGRTVFCVGDPMQSIYRFRQAEVGLFLDLQTQGLPNVAIETLRLQTNFRSTRPIVDWINTQFPRVLPAYNDSELGAVVYSPSASHVDAAQAGGVYVHAAIGRSNQQEALAITALVEQALADNDNNKIAILVSGRTHVGAIARALSQAGVAFNAVDIERLQERPLVQDLVSLTRALLHLGDRTAWLSCLRAPWCGLNLHELHAIANEQPAAAIWSLLNEPALMDKLEQDAANRVQRFIAILAMALSERGKYPLHDWVERCWLALSGPAVLNDMAELDDANAYFARLDEIEVAGDLADVTQLEIQLNDLFATPKNAIAARVEIMTIHKSKGLEFDVVILPSLHRSGARDSTRLLRWTRLTGLSADGLVLSPPQEKGGEHDAIYDWLSTLEQQRTQLERGRLLYVAATRAKRELHLFGSVAVDATGEKLLRPRADTLLDLLWHAVETQFQACLGTQPSAPNTIAIRTAPLLRRLPLEWQPPVIGNSVVGLTTRRVISEELEHPEFDWVGETSRHIGTVVHAELEYLMTLSIDSMLKWNAMARRTSLTLQLAEQGVPEIYRNAACDRVIKAIEHTLADSRGRWILGINTNHEDASSELALSGVIDNVIVNSVIDRSFIDEQGIRWVIDFKTSTHEGGGREIFLASEAERYRKQLQRYATLMRAWKPDRPVKTALYFPLMNEWREL